MLRSTRGYFLLELLLSLSAWLMLSLFLLPLLIELREQSRQLEWESKARQLMYEELQTKLISNKTFSNYTTILNGVEYQITWKDTGAADQKEVCVRIEKNSLQPETEICRPLE
ncbi:competence protein ComGE [Neobacillus sp. B4I6]|jgi:competence protein ComGE